MRDKINELIPKAINTITTTGIADSQGNVKKEFKRYIASIGASIIQAGLLPTLAFYQKKSDKKEDSYKVLDALLILIKKDSVVYPRLINYLIAKCPSINTNNNSKDKDELFLIEEDIMDAIIALKLALRTFKIENNE